MRTAVTISHMLSQLLTVVGVHTVVCPHVQSRVEMGRELKAEHVPTHHHRMVVLTARGQLLRVRRVMMVTVLLQVSC